MTISVRLSDEDTKLIKAYADFNNISISDLIRKAVLEKIEDEYDSNIVKEAYEEYEKDDKKTRPIEELWKELDI